ncbi:MAG: class I SAM-dependent methyltransferase [Candidatus Pacebacteria bacterium]|nr:class I SAM-dependent methyltransferase [Candidatus Paceibacterota bacterium]
MTDQKTIQAYDKGAVEYHADNQRNEMLQPHIARFLSLIPGKKILDLGCGSGRDAKIFLENSVEYTGVDASQGMLDHARQFTGKADCFLLADFSNLSFPAESFDGIWASAVLLHAEKKELAKILKNLHEILKIGGIGFITLKPKKNIDEGMIAQEKWGGIERYFSFYDIEEFSLYLKEAGFSIIETGKDFEPDGTEWLYFFIQK